MPQNIIADKSFDFAVRVVNCCDWLRKQKRDYILVRQLLRSGTSIGANVEEGIGGVSRPDFINKLQTAYKEARETRYWLRLLGATNQLTADVAQSMMDDVEEILRILGAILKSSKGDSEQS